MHPLLYEINTRCWLKELSRAAGRLVTLAQIPEREFANWQQNVPDSELVLIPGDSYHISASYPDACAREAAAFLRRRASKHA